jgi:hypothetical protein
VQALGACIDGALAAWFSGCAVLDIAAAVYPRLYSIVDGALPA